MAAKMEYSKSVLLFHESLPQKTLNLNLDVIQGHTSATNRYLVYDFI